MPRPPGWLRRRAAPPGNHLARLENRLALGVAGSESDGGTDSSAPATALRRTPGHRGDVEGCGDRLEAGTMEATRVGDSDEFGGERPVRQSPFATVPGSASVAGLGIGLLS